ncbi:acetyl-CoA synthetase-like protein [Setomelanomma holmii]|uniref:Acetyl-CoA synthetase-like protein n=1 Tax=Setomelanomma holmii TaxID=210430 RepID=A0A9P4LPJ2_9PLEO|nr:acetyl-CoA synthetase-like protein [Setomelanomma holmii]
MAQEHQSWPQINNELLPHTVFRLAELLPNSVHSEHFSDGSDLANAVHATAWWIEKNVGKPRVSNGSEARVYFGPNDLRYGILVLASVCVGYKMLFPSPRYGADAITKLIEQVNGNIMLNPNPRLPVSAQVLQKRPMKIFQIPSLGDLLTAETQPYPFNKTFEQHKHEPLVCLHTSGTTGFPKPILWTHDWAQSFLESISLPDPSEKHRAAVHFKNTDTRTERGVDIVAIPPPHAEYLGSNPALLDRVAARAKKLVWSGGEIFVAAGNAIAAKMRPHNELGSTELGLWPSLERNAVSDENWQYVPIHPAMNMRLDPVAKTAEGEDICEGVMVKNDESGWVQPLFRIYTDVKEKSLGDLFVRHPQHPELLRPVGRTDDMLYFQSEKFFPAVAEGKIAAHLGVEQVMMVGTKRSRGALIIRLQKNAKLDDELPVYARIERHMILVVKQPFLLTAKGTVQKKAMLDLYERELDELYGSTTSTP